MRNNTQRIYERLSRGEFLSVDSTDPSIRHLYEDIEENLEDYIGTKKSWILNTKLRELYSEYINSDEFNVNEINRLKKKKMGDNYINRYKYLAKNLIEYFAQ